MGVGPALSALICPGPELVTLFPTQLSNTSKSTPAAEIQGFNLARWVLSTWSFLPFCHPQMELKLERHVLAIKTPRLFRRGQNWEL